MLRCESCASCFKRVGDLFEHIQSSCLAFYKAHPEYWSEILGKMTIPGGNESPRIPPSTGLTPSDTVATLEQKPQALPTSSNSMVNEHSSTKDPSVPFCIMFKPQKVKLGDRVKNLHMTVMEYFYGTLTGSRAGMKKISRNCHCSDCGKSLRNNIRFMSHLRHKILNGWETKEGNIVKHICKHCYREYASPFLLQCHLEKVHGTLPSACTCRICELDFPSERTFLFHMKDNHVQNEAPYFCKVCNYRSSFYNDVTKHFRDEHSDTSGLMCPFCLGVFYAPNSFLKHVLQHRTKGTECKRCRLNFATDKEQATHLQNDHGSQLMKEKLQKFKDLHRCRVYVRVSPLKNKWSEPDNLNLVLKRTSSESLSTDDASTPAPPKKALKTPTVELPAYLRPLKRSNKVKKLQLHRISKKVLSNMKCAECGEPIEPHSMGLKMHFEHTHECRWCVYVTSCEKASQNHVLREHADSELRDQLLGKKENDSANFPIIIDDEDDVCSPKLEEPLAELLPISAPASEVVEPMAVEEPNSETNLISDDQNKPISPELGNSTATKNKPRRKQSNPMKIEDLYMNTSPKKPCKEKQVQAKVNDREKGVQTSDHDFLKLEVKVNEKYNKTKSRVGRNVQLLAPGCLPDIDDDAGWSKYFANAEIDMQSAEKSKKTLSNPKNSALPTMVPRHSTLEILNKALSSQSSITSKPTSRTIAPKSATTAKPKSAVKANSGGQQLPSKVAVATTNGSLYQFQVVTSTNATTCSPVLTSTTTVSKANGNLKSRAKDLVYPNLRPPVNVRCLEVSHCSMLIQWDPPGGCAVTQYKIIFQGSGPQTVQILPAEQTLVKLVGLKPNILYIIQVYSMYYSNISENATLYVKTTPTTTTTSIRSLGGNRTIRRTTPLQHKASATSQLQSLARGTATFTYLLPQTLKAMGSSKKITTNPGKGESGKIILIGDIATGLPNASQSSKTVANTGKVSTKPLSKEDDDDMVYLVVDPADGAAGNVELDKEAQCQPSLSQSASNSVSKVSTLDIADKVTVGNRDNESTTDDVIVILDDVQTPEPAYKRQADILQKPMPDSAVNATPSTSDLDSNNKTKELVANVVELQGGEQESTGPDASVEMTKQSVNDDSKVEDLELGQPRCLKNQLSTDDGKGDDCNLGQPNSLENQQAEMKLKSVVMSTVDRQSSEVLGDLVNEVCRKLADQRKELQSDACQMEAVGMINPNDQDATSMTDSVATEESFSDANKEAVEELADSMPQVPCMEVSGGEDSSLNNGPANAGHPPKVSPPTELTGLDDPSGVETVHCVKNESSHDIYKNVECNSGDALPTVESMSDEVEVDSPSLEKDTIINNEECGPQMQDLSNPDQNSMEQPKGKGVISEECDPIVVLDTDQSASNDIHLEIENSGPTELEASNIVTDHVEDKKSTEVPYHAMPDAEEFPSACIKSSVPSEYADNGSGETCQVNGNNFFVTADAIGKKDQKICDDSAKTEASGSPFKSTSDALPHVVAPVGTRNDNNYLTMELPVSPKLNCDLSDEPVESLQDSFTMEPALGASPSDPSSVEEGFDVSVKLLEQTIESTDSKITSQVKEVCGDKVLTVVLNNFEMETTTSFKELDSPKESSLENGCLTKDDSSTFYLPTIQPQPLVPTSIEIDDITETNSMKRSLEVRDVAASDQVGSTINAGLDMLSAGDILPEMDEQEAALEDISELIENDLSWLSGV